jgi:hypothetical protein
MHAKMLHHGARTSKRGLSRRMSRRSMILEARQPRDAAETLTDATAVHVLINSGTLCRKQRRYGDHHQ